MYEILKKLGEKSDLVNQKYTNPVEDMTFRGMNGKLSSRRRLINECVH